MSLFYYRYFSIINQTWKRFLGRPASFDQFEIESYLGTVCICSSFGIGNLKNDKENQSITRSINQSINHSLNHSTNQSLNHVKKLLDLLVQCDRVPLYPYSAVLSNIYDEFQRSETMHTITG